MFSIEETRKIIEFFKLEKQYEKVYEEVYSIIQKRYKDFEDGDRIGHIIAKTEIPQTAQKNEDGTYVTYHQVGEDWGNGTIYLPLDNDYKKFLEIYYST